MPTPWQSQAYRNVYEDLVRQMDPSSIQDKCFGRGLITSEQRDDLSHLNGAKHNRSLLSVLEKLNDDQYEVFCQVLLKNAVHVHDHSVAEMRKASDGAAASASTHGQPATSSATSPVEGNPFKTEEYLITSGQVFLLSTTYRPIGRVEHSRELFRLMEAGGSEAIRTSSAEVLPFLGQCARHKADVGKLLAKPVPKALGRAEPRTGTKTQFKERKPNSCTPTGSVEVGGGLLPNRPVSVETPDSQDDETNPVRLAGHQTIRILVAGKTVSGKYACLNTLFAILGSEQNIGVNDFREGDLIVEDHRLVVGGQNRHIVFTKIKGFTGEQTDALLMDALILGRLRHGHRCAVEEIQARPVALHEQCLALIFVVSCEDYVVESGSELERRDRPRVRRSESGFRPAANVRQLNPVQSARPNETESRFRGIAKQFQNVRQVIRNQDIVPITIVTKLWDRETGRIRADYQQVLTDAAEVVGSAPCHVFPFENKFPIGEKGTPQFQARLDWNRIHGLMAMQEVLLQAALRLSAASL